MKTTIRTKNIVLNQRLRDYVEEKIGSEVEKLLVHERPPIEASVELIRLTKHHQKGEIFRAEVQVSLHGHRVISEASGQSIEQAIDEVKDELEREIKKHRGKEKAIRRKGSRFLKKLMHLSPLARFKKK
jgi:putative sigma-54 modulation protein